MTETPPRILASSAVLLVRDVERAANYYRDAMGFTWPRFWGDPPSFVILQRDNHYLMLKGVERPEDARPIHRVADVVWDIYFWVSDADALHEEFVRRGAEIRYAPCDMDYGCREFAVGDLDGYCIGFGQALD